MTSSADTAVKSAIDLARWHFVEAGDSQALAKARNETINIVQWLARIANSFVTARAPKDRVLLAFRAADTAFVTKTFDNGLSLEMRLPSLELQFLENGRPAPHTLDPEEHSPAEAEAWLLVELLHRGVDRTKFRKKLPYTIPNLMTGDAENYSPRSCREGLAQLMAWFQNAVGVLDAAGSVSGAGKAGIVCCPQTLSLSCATAPGPTFADFGFSLGDGQNREPFFYRAARAPNRSAIGDGRAILTASMLLAEKDPAAAARRFVAAGAD